MGPLGGFRVSAGAAAAAAVLVAAAAVAGALAAAGNSPGGFQEYSMTQERTKGLNPYGQYSDMTQAMPLAVPYYGPHAGVTMEGAGGHDAAAAATPTDDPAAAVIQAVRGRKKLQRMILQSMAFFLAMYLLLKLRGTGAAKAAEQEKAKGEKADKKEQQKQQTKQETKQETIKKETLEKKPAPKAGSPGILSWLVRQSAEQEADTGDK